MLSTVTASTNGTSTDNNSDDDDQDSCDSDEIKSEMNSARPRVVRIPVPVAIPPLYTNSIHSAPHKHRFVPRVMSDNALGTITEAGNAVDGEDVTLPSITPHEKQSTSTNHLIFYPAQHPVMQEVHSDWEQEEEWMEKEKDRAKHRKQNQHIGL